MLVFRATTTESFHLTVCFQRNNLHNRILKTRNFITKGRFCVQIFNWQWWRPIFNSSSLTKGAITMPIALEHFLGCLYWCQQLGFLKNSLFPKSDSWMEILCCLNTKMNSNICRTWSNLTFNFWTSKIWLWWSLDSVIYSNSIIKTLITCFFAVFKVLTTALQKLLKFNQYNFNTTWEHRYIHKDSVFTENKLECSF